MRAGKLVAGISCVWILASGCSMCQHPSYDCGPVWTQNGCANCDPDYRAGSVLNRRAQGDMAVEAAPDAKEAPAPAVKPVPPAAQPARITAQPSDGLEPPRRTATAAQPGREMVVRTPVENETRHAPPEDAILPDAPLPDHLSPGTVAAPPGTKDGATRVLSITDHRLDELQRNSKPLAIENKTPQQTAKTPSADLGGWRPVAAQQAPADR